MWTYINGSAGLVRYFVWRIPVGVVSVPWLEVQGNDTFGSGYGGDLGVLTTNGGRVAGAEVFEDCLGSGPLDNVASAGLTLRNSIDDRSDVSKDQSAKGGKDQDTDDEEGHD